MMDPEERMVNRDVTEKLVIQDLKGLQEIMDSPVFPGSEDDREGQDPRDSLEFPA